MIAALLHAGSMFVAAVPPVSEDSVVINEILYHPPAEAGSDAALEFVELFNRSPHRTIDLGGWVVADSNGEKRFVIPEGTVIEAVGFLVLARGPKALATVHGPDLPIVGPVDFSLANDGDTVRLYDPDGALVDRVEYSDRLPWPREADGLGASLERIDADATHVDDFINFAASTPAELSGTPGLVNSRAGPLPTRVDIVINEIQYNPVHAAGVDSLRHCRDEEFVEIHNRGDSPRDISNWQLHGDIEYVFPAATTIAPGAHLAIFRNAAQFREQYGDVPGATGPFTGSLGDGGGDVFVLNVAGLPADHVDYNDTDPWPVNPDGLHGSLELVDPRSDNGRGRAWEESDDFRGTPGRENSATIRFEAAGRNAAPQITGITAATPGNEPGTTISSADRALVRARIIDGDGVESARVEYQVVSPGDYIRFESARYETEWTAIPMTFDFDLLRHQALLPRLAHRTLVRYRIVATDNAGASSVAPLPANPEPNYAYFVYDGVPDYVADVKSSFGEPGLVHTNLERVPVYHLIAHGDDTEDAQYFVHRSVHDRTYYWRGTFVFENHVHDHVPFRLRGNHRYDRPKRHWKIKFNKGNLFRGRYNDGAAYSQRRRKLNINSTQIFGGGRWQGQDGLFETLGFTLFRDAGVAAPRTTWVHFRIVDEVAEGGQYDGDFFGLYLDIQQVDTAFIEEAGRPSEEAGIYKPDEGIEKKSPDCTEDLNDYNALIRGIRDVNTPQWYEENVAIDRYLSFRSMVFLVKHNDLGGHNFYYYRDPSTWKWELIPWDLEFTFLNNISLSDGDPIDRLVRHFDVEYRNRQRYLWETVYESSHVDPLVEQWRELLAEIVRADRERWESEPRETCPGEICFSRYSDFNEIADLLKIHIGSHRQSLMWRFQDFGIPAQPRNRSPLQGETIAVQVNLHSSAFSDADGPAHLSSHWLLIESDGDWAAPLWEIESTEALESLEVPLGILDNARTYRFRVRHRDADGRWSLLSKPTSFRVGSPDTTTPPHPQGLEVVRVGSRSVALHWDATAPPQPAVVRYRLHRDGELIAELGANVDAFVDERAAPQTRPLYTLVAVTRDNVESLPAEARASEVPARSHGGWLAPDGGFDYLYEGGSGEARPVPAIFALGALDGNWMRSRTLDRWDGSIPGEGVAGGVEILVVDGAGEDGGPVSILAIEDPGHPGIELKIPEPNNRMIYFVRDLAADTDDDSDGDLLDRGVTLVARWRVHPNPRDLDVPTDQPPGRGNGQIALIHRDDSGKQNLSFHLEDGKLVHPAGALEVDPFEFQAIWVTVKRANEGDGHHMQIYHNGKSTPAVDTVLTLPTDGTELFVTDYLAMGLSNSLRAGAIQVDFIGYRRGVHTPVVRASSAPFTRGDVNGDDRVTITDAVNTLEHLFRRSGDSLPCLDAADGDDSGTLNVSDVVRILLAVFGRVPIPPPVSPQCAPDPTEDGLSCRPGRRACDAGPAGLR